tara:strand:+ start:433 stop:987 length:555 start_codon:yes stop_codon:yes gene_type:complete
MKTIIAILSILLIVSCKSNTEKENAEINAMPNESTSITSESETGAQGSETSGNTSETTSTASEVNAGTYINLENKDAETGCNTLTLSFNATTPLCIDKEGITINVRYKNENGTTNMYYDSLESNTSDKKVPFNTFDTTVPIAVLTQTSNNTLTLDWKGFSVNGDLAVDYAILGKKNLEGKFVKQ